MEVIMTKHVFFYLIVLVVVFCMLPTQAYAKWHAEIHAYGESGRMSTSLVMDTNDEPHVSYLDQPTKDLIYLHREGITWTYSEVNLSGDVNQYHALTLDANNHPYIAYYDMTAEQMICAFWDGSAWTRSVVADQCYPGSHRSIVLDASGYPHISARQTGDSSLVHAWWDGASWQTENVDPNGHGGSSIAVDSAYNICISYLTGKPDYELKFACYDGTAWQIDTVDNAGDLPLYPCLAIDSNDSPHIAYFDYDPNYDLKYAYRNGANWIVQNPYPGGRVGYNPSLALDHLDRPHIAFRIYTAERLLYAFWNGFEWIVELADEGGGYDSSIALDSKEQPHCFFCSQYPVELRYAWKTVVWERLEMSDTTFEAGELFRLDRRCGNGEDADVAVDEFLILDVYGSYWYWPTWSEDVDFQSWTLETGQEYSDTILEFSWPAGSGSAPGLKFWAAFLNAGTANLICYDIVEWSYM